LKTETTTISPPAQMGRVKGPLRKAALRTVVNTMEPVVAMVFIIESVYLMESATSTPPSAPTAAQPIVMTDQPAKGLVGLS